MDVVPCFCVINIYYKSIMNIHAANLTPPWVSPIVSRGLSYIYIYSILIKDVLYHQNYCITYIIRITFDKVSLFGHLGPPACCINILIILEFCHRNINKISILLEKGYIADYYCTGTIPSLLL